MANPSYYKTSAPVRSQVQHQEHLFHLYAFQQLGTNEFNIVPEKTGLPNFFGRTNVMDWDVHDAPDTKAAVVARLQGLAVAARRSIQSWYSSFNVVFTDERFKGSTISVQGPLGPTDDEGDWAVVGGTGEFVHAQGTCSYKRMQTNSDGGIMNELRIRVVCLIFPKPVHVQKVGPWGGNGGTTYEIQDRELPQRLESITVYSNNDFIQTIAFAYTDQAGEKRTAGPWGGDAGKSKHPTIHFGRSETVKKIYGSNGKYGGHTVVTSLAIVTNVKTYGPYGKHTAGNTAFHITPPNNHNIVGFYGRVGDIVDQIGVYVSPN